MSTPTPCAAHARLLKNRKRLTYLHEDRGLSAGTITRAEIGWDGERYTIPVYDGLEVVNVRRYDPAARNKVIGARGSGVRLYAPAEPPNETARVLFTEGEMDCLKGGQELPEWWVVTTTGGAAKPPPASDLERVRGRHVVIAYDCDAAGRNGALKLAAALEPLAASVRVADLSLGEHEDVTDWFITHGRDAAALERVLLSAPFYLAGEVRDRTKPSVLLDRALDKARADGSRNEACFWLACQLRDERYTEEEAKPTIRDYAQRAAADKAQPFPESEALDSLRSAYSEPPREPLSHGAGGAERPRYSLIPPATLAEPVPPMEWLIDGLWPRGSYGPWGGAKKSLKTYSASLAAIAVAAGVPAFNNDAWAVPKARPVIYYGGEGGEHMHRRRFQRIATEVYGLDLASMPFYLVTDVGPFDSPEFQEAIRRNIAEVERKHAQAVGLVVLDSLYNYHPAGIEVTNLYERGRLLAGLSTTLLDRDVALWVVDHFNKTGSGIDLDRLAQSGMSAWADSWVLFEHATAPDVANGDFSLSMGIGSRQWGGDEWTAHINIGPFDSETRDYLTPMKIETVRGIAERTRGPRTTDSDISTALLSHMETHPRSTKNKACDAVATSLGVGDRRVRAAFDRLAEGFRLIPERAKVREGSREVKREVWIVGDGKVRTSLAQAPSADPEGEP